MAIRLLLVDDDPEQFNWMFKAANWAGFVSADVLAAPDVERAREMIRQDPPQLAVIDIRLPERFDPRRNPTEETNLGGLELIKLLREEHPACRIIALTSAQLPGGQQLLIRAIDAGAHDFINVHWPNTPWVDLLKSRLSVWRQVIEAAQQPALLGT